ncbi:MAG TPA: cytochrome P450 [Steroidobacteraceae bacterium]|nr:cytochrome P450 [Steroidobacteraceae bacterium]
MAATQDSAKPAIPSHVPPELVRPIGLTEGPEFLAAPHAFMAALHDTHPPIFFSTSEHASNAWMLINYEDVFFVLRHPEIFTTAGATPFPRDPNDYFYMIPLEIDPPHHRKYRAMIDPMVSPKAVAGMEDPIRRLANQLIDQFIARGECEFTTEFGRPLPVSVFLGLMGLPQEMRDTFVGWAMGLLHSQDRNIAERCMRETVAYLKTAIEDKKRKPDDSVLSAIVHGKADGEPLTPKEVFGFTFFLFIAGLDTVFATLNNVFLWLAQNPDRRREIIANPDNIAATVEELLRVFSVTFSGRTLTRDYEMRGVKFKKGDKITSILPAANYDPAAFENPKEVNFHRPRKPNLAFAGGVHSCMGAHLARLEMKISITEFLARIPDFRLKEGTRIEYWPGGVVGPKTVPLKW